MLGLFFVAAVVFYIETISNCVFCLRARSVIASN